jgi:glycosyltransferase involved in cell wall biosynthesis
LRILLVLIEPPMPFGSAVGRWYYVLLRGLVERGHRVTAFAACSKPEEIARAGELFPRPRYDLRCYPFPRRRGLRAKLESLRRPFSYMFGPDLRRDLNAELARGYDILHLEGLAGGWISPGEVERVLVTVQFLFAIDLADVRPRGFREALERWQMLSMERRLVRRLRHFLSCTPRLVPHLLALNPRADVTTVPLGIDVGQYRYIPDEERTGPPVVSVIGSMGWYPSRSAAERFLTRLWPAIKKRVPDAQAQVVGWRAREVLKDYLSLPDVAIEENVPDIKPYFQRTGVLLYAPGRGSGIKIKVQEALAFGVPVVTTSEGIEGIPAVDGVHVGLAEDDAGLIEKTVRLLQDPRSQNRQREAGRALIELHCGPKPTLDALEAIYQRMCAGRGQESGVRSQGSVVRVQESGSRGPVW